MRNLLIALALCGVLAMGCGKKQAAEESGDDNIPEVTVPGQTNDQDIPPVTTPGQQQESQSGSN